MSFIKKNVMPDDLTEEMLLRHLASELYLCDGWFINSEGKLMLQDVDQDEIDRLENAGTLSNCEFTFPTNKLNIKDGSNLERLIEKKDISCCMACKYWRYTQGKTGECRYFDKSVYTDEGFSCKAFMEIKIE